MAGNLLKKIWSFRFQFIKYAVTGISAVILDMTSLFILKEDGGLSPVTAVVINQIFIINYVFFLNKIWSFGARGLTGQQMTRFLLVSLWNYTFAIFWMSLFYERIQMNYLLARILNIILAVSWNFLLYKYFVYRIGSGVEAPAELAVEEVEDK